MEIDILKLYTESNSEKWNYFLSDCLMKQDINRLISTRIGLQVGVDRLYKRKLSTPKINEFFIRLNRSIENTAQKIIKRKNPVTKNMKDYVEVKRKRDNEWEVFLLKSSY